MEEEGGREGGRGEWRRKEEGGRERRMEEEGGGREDEEVKLLLAEAERDLLGDGQGEFPRASTLKRFGLVEGESVLPTDSIASSQ